MKFKSKLFYCLFFFSILFPTLSHAGLSERSFFGMKKKSKPATIKILLSKNSEGALVEVKGSYKVIDPKTNHKLSSGYKGKRYYAYPHKKGIKWGEDFIGTYQIRILPTNSDTTIFVDGIQYKGCIDIYHVEGSLRIVNEVDIENYLKSMMTFQFTDEYPQSVMDAIAIVERTHAYYTALFNNDAFWHLNAQEIGYYGYGITLTNLATDRAVERTRHLVMTYEEQPFPTMSTTNCAGKTASFQNIYRKNTLGPHGVTSDFAAKDRDESLWSLEISTDKLAKISKTNRVTGIELFTDPESKKTYAIRVKDGLRFEDIDFVTLQEEIGKGLLLSNDFKVHLSGNKISFEGYGEGTGVGLCLYSAAQMAERGDLAPKILSAFYPLTQLEKMPSYPDLIISNSNEYFISPNRLKGDGKRGL